MVNTDKVFLDAIHVKIIRKKRQWSTIFTSVLILMVIFISYESSKIIQTERYDLQWSKYQYDQKEYYSWEVNDKLSDDELFSAMLYLYDMVEILDFLDDLPELLETLKTTSLEG